MTTPTQFGPEDDSRLDGVFRAYREACEFGEGNPDFMPLLWQRIESRRVSAVFTQRFARIFATATVALAVLAGMAVSLSPQRGYEDTWVETIANHNLDQNAVYYERVRLSPISAGPAALGQR